MRMMLCIILCLLCHIEPPGVINSTYSLTQEIVTAYRTILNDWFEDGNSIGRFSGVYGHLYNGVK